MAKKAETAAKNSKTSSKSAGFSAEEKAAMKERAAEMKAEAKSAKNREAGEADLQSKIAAMEEPDRTLATRIHAIVTANAPGLLPKTWYGMPAYADKDGKIVCFLQPAKKFETRYATLGFNDSAKLDDGSLFPVAYAVMEVTAAEEKKIAALIKKAVG